ncbi:type II toxin-antitoxin system RelE/ParE family toxin [Pseudomonas sp. JH-2]|uniref:type II toxin-antitoxin system RelE/ParE family toxin n=1 Tax=Pseudomonas sp. JH-2 TaxID=3114998 RepID=UPI002E26FD88|nr:type II toxin-antitoxin system RelE/ParE family toxin [Pseudomonas sp. JH-2]
MKVLWTPQAEQDRSDIWDYIAVDNPSAAVRMDELFSRMAGALTQFPQRGKPGRIPGTRELIPHEHHRLVYQVEDEVVRILALVHTARHWPPLQV